MSRFRFVYQALLDARIAEERARQRTVSRVMSRQSELQSELIRRHEYIESQRHLAREQLVGSVNIDVLRSYAGQSVQAMRRVQAILIEMSEVHRVLKTAREELLEYRRRRQGIECMRDRALRRWKKECRRKEIREQDDLASVRAARESGKVMT